MRIFAAIVVVVLAATEAFAGQTSAQIKVGITITGAAAPAVPKARQAPVTTGSARLVPTRSVTHHGNTTIVVEYY